MKLKLDQKQLLIIIAMASQTAILSLGQSQPVLACQQSESICSDQSSEGRTFQEIGLEDYRNYLVNAKRELETVSSSESIGFPLGLNCPIQLETDSENRDRNQAVIFQVVGYLDINTGTIQAITSGDLINLFDRHLQTLQGSNLSEIRVANPLYASDPNFSQEIEQLTLPAVSLIVLNTEDNQTYLLPNVQFSTVFKDALNATLTQSLTRSQFDLNSLDIDQLIQLPSNESLEI
ncbi:MAG: hypothetical protein HC840_11830 [Leptolyngbyaceae cyanobacterium RM2_2_4]|nr:hypothetical protein [Leptolyngbyaceae cyanobacterium RM2_2_4]